MMAEKDAKKKEEDGDEAEAAAPVAASGSGKKKILLAGGFVVLLCIVAGSSILLLTRKNAKANEQLAADAALEGGGAELTAEGADDQEELGEDEERLGTIAPLETFVVNLTGGKYLRAQVQVEFEGTDIPSRFVTRVVPIRDGIIGILTKKGQSDLETPKGKEDLKKEIKEFVNELLHKEDVKRVYFTQFVVQ